MSLFFECTSARCFYAAPHDEVADPMECPECHQQGTLMLSRKGRDYRPVPSAPGGPPRVEWMGNQKGANLVS